MEQTNEIQYFTTKEVQVMLKVSRGTLNRWRKEGKISVTKVNKTVRYKLVDIKKCMGGIL